MMLMIMIIMVKRHLLDHDRHPLSYRIARHSRRCSLWSNKTWIMRFAAVQLENQNQNNKTG